MDKSHRLYDGSMWELLKLGGRLLPIEGSVRKLSPLGLRALDYSLRLLEILAVVLEPLVDEPIRDLYENALREIMDADPKLCPGPKEYPNDYLSRILLDNYLQLLKLTTLYFNLSLSSLVTRYLVNLVYKLECWEIYHLLQAMPNFEYYLNLLGFEITATPLGHIVKPPGNYLGFNLRQGLQYTFPFPFYNYSYHSTRPEARFEKYCRVHVEPYMDIRLNKSLSKKSRGKQKSQRFSSAVAERVLEGGFLLPFRSSRQDDEKGDDVYDVQFSFRIVRPDDILRDYQENFAEEDSDTDIDEPDGEEDHEKIEDYCSDDDAHQNSVFSRKFRFVFSGYVQKLPQKKRTLAFPLSKEEADNFKGQQNLSVCESSPYSGQLGLPYPNTRLSSFPEIENSGNYFRPSFDAPLSKHATSENLSASAANKNPDITASARQSQQATSSGQYIHLYSSYPGAVTAPAAYGSLLIDNSQLLAANPSGITRVVSQESALETCRSAEPRNDSSKVVRDVPRLPSQSILQRSSSVHSKKDHFRLSSSDRSGSNAWSPLAHGRATTTTIGDSLPSSQYTVAPGYAPQLLMRQDGMVDQAAQIAQAAHVAQAAQTGQPVAQIVTLPAYGLPSYNPYSSWLAPQGPAHDKTGESKPGEPQNMMMSGYQKYLYAEAYNPYTAYPTYAAPMYTSPDQIYYAPGANMGYSQHSQQYSYMNPMYAPQYAKLTPITSEDSRTQQVKRKSMSMGENATKKILWKEKSRRNSKDTEK